MIINKDLYRCPKCHKGYFFDTSKPFSTICPLCKVEMEFQLNIDSDTELAAINKAKQAQQEAIAHGRGAECPYCKSRDTKKISATGRMFSASLFGLGSDKIGKQWHCNNCNSDF